MQVAHTFYESMGVHTKTSYEHILLYTRRIRSLFRSLSQERERERATNGFFAIDTSFSCMYVCVCVCVCAPFATNVGVSEGECKTVDCDVNATCLVHASTSIPPPESTVAEVNNRECGVLVGSHVEEEEEEEEEGVDSIGSFSSFGGALSRGRERERGEGRVTVHTVIDRVRRKQRECEYVLYILVNVCARERERKRDAGLTQ